MSHPEFRIEDLETQIPLIDENEDEDDPPTKRNSITPPPLSLTGLSNLQPLPSSPNQNNNALERIIPLHRDGSRSGLIAPNSAGLPPCPGSPLHSLETSLWSNHHRTIHFLLLLFCLFEHQEFGLFREKIEITLSKQTVLIDSGLPWEGNLTSVCGEHCSHRLIFFY